MHEFLILTDQIYVKERWKSNGKINYAKGVRNESMSINGDGKQTRSFCFVDDLVEGLFKLMNSDLTGPYNFGSTDQISIIELAKLISKRLKGFKSKILRIHSR